MTSVLHIAGSPLRHQSRTRLVAERFLAQYMLQRAEAQVRELDIWSTDLPAFDEEMIAAKFAVLRAKDPTAAQLARWEQAVVLARSFNQADLYVLGVPMWNFSIPYRLKHLMDIVTLPEQNWRWSRAEGYVPLLHEKRAVVVYSSAGDYRQASLDPRDHQKPLIRQWLAFLGIEKVHELNIAPTLADPVDVERVANAALVDADALAREIAHL